MIYWGAHAPFLIWLSPGCPNVLSHSPHLQSLQIDNLHGVGVAVSSSGMRSRRRILFLAEGATMAHFVRPLALAETLEPDRYEIHFYAPSRYSGHLDNKLSQQANWQACLVSGSWRISPKADHCFRQIRFEATWRRIAS